MTGNYFEILGFAGCEEGRPDPTWFRLAEAPSPQIHPSPIRNEAQAELFQRDELARCTKSEDVR